MPTNYVRKNEIKRYVAALRGASQNFSQLPHPNFRSASLNIDSLKDRTCKIVEYPKRINIELYCGQKLEVNP